MLTLLAGCGNKLISDNFVGQVTNSQALIAFATSDSQVIAHA